MGIGLLTVQSLYFMLPAYLANCSPLFFRKTLKSLAFPVDFKKKFRGRPVFGPHKTFRGIIAAVVAGILVFLLQYWLFDFGSFQKISLVNYRLLLQEYNILPGFLLGSGAIIGDLVKSFFKRQLNIRAGERWFPWDQTDFLVGALLFVSVIYIPSWEAIVILFISTPIIHIVSNHVGYYLKIREVKW